MVRRVVGGQQSARAIIDGIPAKVFSQDGFSLAEIWATEAPAPDLKSERDIAVGFQGVAWIFHQRHPFWSGRSRPPTHGQPHKTPTIDYLVLLDGEIDLLFDNGSEVHLKQGDCVVQLGAMHAWHNRSGHTTRMAAVAVGGTGGQSTHR